jgi:hypothetical protein
VIVLRLNAGTATFYAATASIPIETSLNPAVEAQLDAALVAAGAERSTGRS